MNLETARQTWPFPVCPEMEHSLLMILTLEALSRNSNSVDDYPMKWLWVLFLQDSHISQFSPVDCAQTVHASCCCFEANLVLVFGGVLYLKTKQLISLVQQLESRSPSTPRPIVTLLTLASRKAGTLSIKLLFRCRNNLTKKNKTVSKISF